jgi:hypothetical protein
MSSDFFVDVQRGALSEYSIIHKFGRNDSVPNGVWELVSSSSISGALPSSGTTVRIKAGGDAADTAAGAGARKIAIIGLDSNYQEITEEVVTSGANASLPTTNVFWRLYRAYVVEVGTYGDANTDDIVIENSDGSEDRLVITADEGQTQHAVYSIPVNKTGYLLSVHITADASKAADFRLFVRENLSDIQAPVQSRQLKLYWDGIIGEVSYKPKSPGLVLNELSDIWVEARGGGALTQVSVDFEILLKDDPAGPIQQA